MSARENPPAFPLAVQPDFQFANNGMTLRDWFASQALACIVRPDETADVFAKAAYQVADAMLAERAKVRP